MGIIHPFYFCSMKPVYPKIQSNYKTIGIVNQIMGKRYRTFFSLKALFVYKNNKKIPYSDIFRRYTDSFWSHEQESNPQPADYKLNNQIFTSYLQPILDDVNIVFMGFFVIFDYL